MGLLSEISASKVEPAPFSPGRDAGCVTRSDNHSPVIFFYNSLTLRRADGLFLCVFTPTA